TLSRSIAEPRTTWSSRTRSSVSQWNAVGERSRTSRPSDLAACPWVSRSITSTRCRFSRASQAAAFTASVVLPVPPFSLMNAMRRTPRASGRLGGAAGLGELLELALHARQHALQILDLGLERLHV